MANNNINLNDIMGTLSTDLMNLLKKEEKWVFDMNDEEFRHMVEDCELPVYEAARRGLYEHYQEVPTRNWMMAFRHVRGTIEGRVLFAMLHNAIWRQSRNHLLKPEYQKEVSPFKFVVRPYQGFGHYATF